MDRIDDEFELYNLRVEVIGDEETFVCSHYLGLAFEVIGENLVFENAKHKKFSFYSLSSILPLLAAKQRQTDGNDWISSDEVIACPDSNCGAKFLIKRMGVSKFRHSEVTVEPRKGKVDD